jgi:hypothetical protein
MTMTLDLPVIFQGNKTGRLDFAGLHPHIHVMRLAFAGRFVKMP